MSSVPPLLSFLLMIVSGRVCRHRRTVLELLPAKNRLLKKAESEANPTTELPIIDRDTKYTDQFRRLVRVAGTAAIRISSMSNPYPECFGRPINEQCLNRVIFIGQASPHRAAFDPMGHCRMERNRQGPGNRLIGGHPTAVESSEFGRRRQRAGGTLNFYYRKAA